VTIVVPRARRADQPHKQAAEPAMSKSLTTDNKPTSAAAAMLTNDNNTWSEVIVGVVDSFFNVGVFVVASLCQHRKACAR
jgi:hypothetical protein